MFSISKVYLPELASQHTKAIPEKQSFEASYHDITSFKKLNETSKSHIHFIYLFRWNETKMSRMIISYCSTKKDGSNANPNVFCVCLSLDTIEFQKYKTNTS